jgi:hypothetical protein
MPRHFFGRSRPDSVDSKGPAIIPSRSLFSSVTSTSIPAFILVLAVNRDGALTQIEV